MARGRLLQLRRDLARVFVLPADQYGFNADFGTNNLADNHRKVDIDQYALFGEMSYELPDHFKATSAPATTCITATRSRA